MNLASLVSPTSDHLDGALAREAAVAGTRLRETEPAYDPDQAIISAHPVRPARS